MRPHSQLGVGERERNGVAGRFSEGGIRDARTAPGQEQTRKKPRVCGVFEFTKGDRGSRKVV